ncbi:unnamed protein product [Paramecium primaurelia]|uniref:Transmembrane protein n=1 Tax=Paramecium primaurelia TaxID=5886 RepID=A0A8S1K6W1_PARPR|nr:unnamed protein product [Paramecium primaurelia]
MRNIQINKNRESQREKKRKKCSKNKKNEIMDNKIIINQQGRKSKSATKSSKKKKNKERQGQRKRKRKRIIIINIILIIYGKTIKFPQLWLTIPFIKMKLVMLSQLIRLIELLPRSKQIQQLFWNLFIERCNLQLNQTDTKIIQQKVVFLISASDDKTILSWKKLDQISGFAQGQIFSIQVKQNVYFQIKMKINLQVEVLIKGFQYGMLIVIKTDQIIYIHYNQLLGMLKVQK